MKNKYIYIIILFITTLVANYEYSLEDHNSTSQTYSLDVWLPEYIDYITLHYFSSQGWSGWTNTFGQLSDFQEDLRNDGYENIVIIAIGQSNISSFNENFCANSDLPLVMDQFPLLPIRDQFFPYGQHKQIVILDYNGNFLGSYTLNNGLNWSARNYITNIIANNYQQSVLGDINNDQIVNIQDIIALINMILIDSVDSNGDLNLDGLVNILDLVELVSIILD